MTTTKGGKLGGMARAKNHSKEELSAWAKKGRSVPEET